MRWVAWIEPFGPKSEPVYCRVSEETAKAHMAHTAARRGFTYNTEEDMLEDFMAVYWAQFCDPPD